MMEAVEWLQEWMKWLQKLLVLHHPAYSLVEGGLADDTSSKHYSVSCPWLQGVCFDS